MSSFLVTDCRQYDIDRARWIAEEHSRGASLASLAKCHPDQVPAPGIVARWRREFPAFDVLMNEAERLRADCLADATIDIADDSTITAAAAGNRIKARQWLAARLDRAKYGNTPHHAIPPNQDTGNGERDLSRYSDAELQDIIRAGLQATSIDGQAKRVEPPGTPPHAERPGVEPNNGSDTPIPKISEKETPVTSNETNVPDF